MKPAPRIILLLASVAAPLTLSAQSPDAAAIFDVHHRAIVQVQVIESNSNAKTTTGTGFFVSANGHLITNYHVVSPWVLEPETHRIVLVRDADSIEAQVIALDIVNDVAVLASGHATDHVLAFAAGAPRQGGPLYSFGYPGELGLTIVGGTYNGALEHSLHERIHFTGSLNPGMSGGPTVDPLGRVVGINVATAGNQLSFLVPAAPARTLLRDALLPGYETPPDFIAEIGRQLSVNQDAYLDRILAEPFPTTALDRFQVPTTPAPFFNCWGDTNSDDDDRWEYIGHQCTTIDRVYVSPDYSGAVLRLQHNVLRSDSLNAFRFANLFSSTFNQDVWMAGDAEDVTDYRCMHDNVRTGERVMLAAFCLRALVRFPGLYDVIFKSASIGLRRSALETTLEMSAVSYDKARRIARAILDATSWQ